MKFKSTLLVGLLAVSIAAPALAANNAPAAAVTQFTTADAQSIFEQNTQPIQLTALSQQEMQQTQAAAFNLTTLLQTATSVNSWVQQQGGLKQSVINLLQQQGAGLKQSLNSLNLAQQQAVLKLAVNNAVTTLQKQAPLSLIPVVIPTWK